MFLSATALATPDAKPATKAPATMKVEPKAKAPASQPAKVVKKEKDKPDPLPGMKVPIDVEGGVKEVGTLIGAIKAKAWWLVAASSIFIVMLLLQIFGLFKKMGKRLTWIVAGILSFVAALCLSFDKNGFSWTAFTSFCTAGPTIAWLRGFVKKAVLNKAAKEEKKEEPS